MWNVSSDFLTELRASRIQSVVTVTASTGDVLSVAGGSVEADAGRDITRTASLALTQTPRLPLDQVYVLVMTPSVELTISRGLVLPSGKTELVPLGVFSTSTCPRPLRATKGLSWTGADRAKRISRARLTDVYPVPAGTSLASFASGLVASRAPTIPVDLSGVTGILGAAITLDAGASSDPWRSLRQTFGDAGYELSFSGDGVLRARVIPDPTGATPVFDFGAGSTQLVIDGEMTGSLDGVYSGVIAVGEGTGVTRPTRGEAWDYDSHSPTYMPSFGRVPYFLSSPLLTTNDAAAAAAEGMLPRVVGRRESLSWSSVVAPMLDPLDMVEVDGGLHMVDSWTIPLKASDPMTASGRQTRIA